VRTERVRPAVPRFGQPATRAYQEDPVALDIEEVRLSHRDTEK
jgi:hypothetical protein